MDLKDTLLALEAKGWEALSRPAKAAAFYDDLLTEDALLIFSSGVVRRKEALAAMASAPPWSRYSIQDARVHEVAPDCAVVIYKVTARRTGEPTFTAMIGSTYVQRSGRWRLALHQQSPSV